MQAATVINTVVDLISEQEPRELKIGRINSVSTRDKVTSALSGMRWDDRFRNGSQNCVQLKTS